MMLAIVAIIGYAFVLRIDTAALANLSNWCLSQKAKLEAGRIAFNAIRVKPQRRPRAATMEGLGAEAFNSK